MIHHYGIQGNVVTNPSIAEMGTGASPFSQLQNVDEKFLPEELLCSYANFLANTMGQGLEARHVPPTFLSMYVLCSNLEQSFQICGTCIPVVYSSVLSKPNLDFRLGVASD